MKKFMVAVVMFVTIMSVMVIGPEKAFAKSTNIPEPAAKYADTLMADSTHLVNLYSEGEYTIISQEIVYSEDGEHYDWTVVAYNHELEQIETETVEIDIFDLALTQTYISGIVESL